MNVQIINIEFNYRNWYKKDKIITINKVQNRCDSYDIKDISKFKW